MLGDRTSGHRLTFTVSPHRPQSRLDIIHKNIRLSSIIHAKSILLNDVILK